MFMRTVKMHVNLDHIQNFRDSYEAKILSAFAKIKGCSSAALMQSTHTPEECVSLTLWASEADARAFEESGQYDKLVSVLSPYFSEAYEMQIRLTKDLKLEYSSTTEPEVRRYEVETAHGAGSQGEIYLRMVSLKFKEGKVQEFKKLYEGKIIPLLRSVKGCKSAFLAAPADSPNELISVTEWDSEQAVHEYEHGGQFDAILDSQRHFFPAVYDYGKARSKAATSADVTVDHHHVLIGKSFQRKHDAN
jgi:heme-degrading monooxygenase HmoA